MFSRRRCRRRAPHPAQLCSPKWCGCRRAHHATSPEASHRGAAPPAAHLLFPPGREHQHPGGEPACSPPAGRIGRPSCGGAGRSVNCSGPGISAAL